jgi:hypothetical protein
MTDDLTIEKLQALLRADGTYLNVRDAKTLIRQHLAAMQREAKLLEAVRHIVNDYRDSDEINVNYAEDLGLEREEALEMSYDNIKIVARNVLADIEAMKAGRRTTA